MILALYSLINELPWTDNMVLAMTGELLIIDNGLACLFLFGWPRKSSA